MEVIAVIVGLAGTIAGAAMGYGAFRTRLVLLEAAYKEFRKTVTTEIEGLQRRCNELDNKMSELKGRGAFDPRRSGQHPKP